MADDDAPIASENSKRFKPLRDRLLLELESNGLDFENPPTRSVKDAPHPMYWVPEEPDDSNPNNQNSVAFLNQLRKWELDPPSMSLVVHGGAHHPLYLITDRGLREQRTDFLKSRPRFNDNYFDGQRDPVDGWMSAVNAWRYPAFYVGAQYSMPEFTFKPPNTLFIDAALQAQDDSELIGKEDRVNNEWIMDAVTHQPLGKQSAMKGSDGVFYWDLNVKQKLTPQGRSPPVPPRCALGLCRVRFVYYRYSQPLASPCASYVTLNVGAAQVQCRPRRSLSAICERATTSGGMGCKSNE